MISSVAPQATVTATVEPTPFPHVVRSPFLASSLYNSLAHEFERIRQSRDWPRRPGTTKTSVYSCDPLFGPILARSHLFREWLEELRSQAFVDELCHTFGPWLYRRSPCLVTKWQYVARDQAPLDLARDVLPVTVEACLLEARNGYRLLPHTDNGRKLVSVLLYFPSPRWPSPQCGGTTLYSHPRDIGSDMFGVYALRQDVVPARRIEFRENTFLAFMKTRDSYHGVEPVRCQAGESRNVVILTLVVDDRYQVPPFNRPSVSLLTSAGDVIGSMRHPPGPPQGSCGAVYKAYLSLSTSENGGDPWSRTSAMR